MTSEVVDGLKDEALFRSLDEYPWNEDQEYQHGLQAILGASPSSEQTKQLTLRARCFYYARKFQKTVDFEAYQAWHQSHDATADNSLDQPDPVDKKSTADSKEQPPYPLSFNEIVELITTGKPVPGIKEIPNTILEGQSSGSTTTSRKKPWEV